MMTWRSVTLGEVASVLVGPAFKSRDFSDDPRDIRLLRGANVGVGSSSPVVARMSSDEDIFWVRMNNSTRDLGELETEIYIRDHWSAGRGPTLGRS
jgi:hypothetical protein